MLSNLNYGITLWGFKCEGILKLQQQQTVRILSASKYNAHTKVGEISKKVQESRL